MYTEQIARRFHEVYERLAPSFGYETRPETREFDPASPNGRLMVAVCAEVFCDVSARIEKLEADNGGLRAALEQLGCVKEGSAASHPQARASKTKLRVIEPFRSKDGVRAEIYVSKLGGHPIVVIEADTGAGDPAEVVLNAREAADLRLWLGCALSTDDAAKPISQQNAPPEESIGPQNPARPDGGSSVPREALSSNQDLSQYRCQPEKRTYCPHLDTAHSLLSEWLVAWRVGSQDSNLHERTERLLSNTAHEAQRTAVDATGVVDWTDTATGESGRLCTTCGAELREASDETPAVPMALFDAVAAECGPLAAERVMERLGAAEKTCPGRVAGDHAFDDYGNCRFCPARTSGANPTHPRPAEKATPGYMGDINGPGCDPDVP